MTANTYRKPILLALIILSFTVYLPVISGNADRLTVSQVIGFIGFQLIWWQIVLGNRQLTRFITPDLLWVNKLHRFMGTYGFLIILFHPLLMIASYGLSLVWPPSFASSFDIGVRLGMTALLLLSLTWIISALFRKKIAWRWWKRLHFLGYIVFPLLCLHALLVGSSIQQFWWIGIWLYSIAILFLIIVLMRISGWAGLTKQHHIITGTQLVAKDITRFQLQPKDKDIVPRPGQFAYLQGWRYGEAHPFTVSHYDSSSGEISFSIKAVGPYSRRLNSLKKGATVYIDGPYGVFTEELGTSGRPVVVIAGGIGITPFLRHLEEGNINYLFWGCRSEADIAYRSIIERSGAKTCYVLSKQAEQKPGYEIGTIDVNLLKKRLDQPLPAYDFYLCGPPPMMKSLEKQLSDQGVHPSQIYQEKFSL